MDGYTAISIIRNEMKIHIPVLAMTAYVSEEEVNKVKEAGFNAHIAKPIVPAVLYQSLSEIPFQSKSSENKKIFDEQSADMQYFDALFTEDVEARKEIILAIQQQWFEDKKQLLVNLSAMDCEAAKPTLHSLKSTFSPFGQQSSIYQAIMEMEQNAIKNEPTLELVDNCLKTIEFIDTFVKKIS